MNLVKRATRVNNPERWIVTIGREEGCHDFHRIPVEVNHHGGLIRHVKIRDIRLSNVDLIALHLVLEEGEYRLEPEKAPTIKGVKFKTPKELMKNVVSHGGKVFDPLTYWQSFNREGNEKVLNEVLLHAAKHPDDELYEVTYDGLVNVVDCTYILALSAEAELKTGSVEWLKELDVNDVGKRLAYLKGAETG